MVHLIPLPGSPRYDGSMGAVLDRATSDAAALAAAGFPALLVENFGDAPFRGDHSDSETVAAMTLAVAAVRETTRLPLGVNVLRNDALSALAIAVVTGCEFMRVNVLSGTMYTDQGPIVGKADELMRRRAALGQVEVWADVMVKHATSPPGLDAARAAEDTVLRSLADAVIVSGSGTGAEPGMDDLRAVRAAIPKETRLVIGSGATAANLGRLLEIADTVIVGSSLKADGDPARPVDSNRAAALVEAARTHGLV
jgi:membrane complex biogenesis BtpA family protein